MAFTEDLAAFLGTSDFATAATYDGATAINVIFDNDWDAMPLGMAGQSALRPRAMCRSADIAANPVGKTLLVNAVTYTIAEHQPDGTGMSLLILKR